VKSETSTERSERIINELREATREAAGVLKDMRALVREVCELLPGEAHAAVARELVPSLEAFSVQLTQAVYAAETQIMERFNETGEGLEALLNDLVQRGNLYKIGHPVVEGVDAVTEIIQDARRAAG
jgi:hypothetical protein